jgi:Recombinase
MAKTINFREAVQRVGVSRQRLNEAIRSGRLPATRGGGPGKPTTIQLEDLQAWCVSEGLAMPVEADERLERSQPTALADMVARLEQMFTGMERLERLVEQVLERLKPLQAQIPAELPTPAASERSEHSTPAGASPSKAELMTWLHTLRGAGMSLQNMATELNARGVPTLSGKGRWQKGTIEKLLAQDEG